MQTNPDAATRRRTGAEARFTPEPPAALALICSAPVTPSCVQRSHVLMCPMRRIQAAFAAPSHWQCGVMVKRSWSKQGQPVLCQADRQPPVQLLGVGSFGKDPLAYGN